MSHQHEQRRYVVLRHEGIPEPHYDLLFENNHRTALVSARVFDWPVRHQTRLERLPDHRLMYLDYEGPISGGRGAVRRVAAGTCTTQVDSEDSLLLVLEDGQRIHIPRARWD